MRLLLFVVGAACAGASLALCLAPRLPLTILGPDLVFGRGTWQGPDADGRYAIFSMEASAREKRIRLTLIGVFAIAGLASPLFAFRRARGATLPTPPGNPP